MFLLWTVCIFQLFVLVHNQVKRAADLRVVDPLTKLRKSVLHVIALLDDMDIRIFEQRKRLNELGIPRRRADLDYDEPISTNSEEDPSRRNEPDDLQALLDSLFDNESPGSRMRNTTCAPRPKLRVKLKSLMDQNKAGYFYAALAGIMEILVEKEDKLKMFNLVFGQTLLRMSSEGNLAVLGSSLLFYIKLLWVSLLMTPLPTVIDNVYKAQEAFDNKQKMNPEVLKIIIDYDSFFLTTEGEKLLNVVEELHEFKGTAQESQPLIRRTIESLVAPAERNLGSTKTNDLMDSIYKVCQHRFPDLMSISIDSVIDAISQKHKDQLNETRRKGNIHIKTVIGKLMEQSITSPIVPKTEVNRRVAAKNNLKKVIINVPLIQKQVLPQPLTKISKVKNTTERNITKNNESHRMKTHVTNASHKTLIFNRQMNINKNYYIKNNYISSNEIPNMANNKKPMVTKSLYNENELRRNKINSIRYDTSYSDEEDQLKSMLYKALKL